MMHNCAHLWYAMWCIHWSYMCNDQIRVFSLYITSNLLFPCDENIPNPLFQLFSNVKYNIVNCTYPIVKWNTTTYSSIRQFSVLWAMSSHLLLMPTLPSFWYPLFSSVPLRSVLGLFNLTIFSRFICVATNNKILYFINE